jgi:hypothetical protein
MQVTGEITQSYILDAIVNSPVGNLAILVYMIAAVGFFISVAVFQNYKMGIWLILGPTLWDITSNTRNDEVNVNWKYAGMVVQNQEYLYNFSNPTLSDQNNLNAGPSTVYVMWDGIVSSVVQNLTGLIANITNDPATRLFAKATIQEGLLSAVIKDPDVKEAIKMAMGPHCTPMMYGGNSGAQRWGPLEVIELEEALLNRRVGTIPEQVVRKLCRLKVVHNAWDAGSSESFNDLYNSSPAKSCETAPWSGLSVSGNTLGNCLDFSQAVWEALEVEAERHMRETYAVAGGDSEGVASTGRSLLPQWSQDMLSQDPRSLRRLVATYAARNEMDSLNYLTRSEALSEGQGEQDKDRTAAAIIGWLEKESAQSQAIMFFEAVPYIQGALLYFLSVVYPFICIIMLIPGYHTAMLTWMGAWAWIKSWDIMFYVISFLAGIMSETMIHMGMLHSSLKMNEVVGVMGSIGDLPMNVVEKLQDVNFLHLAVYSMLDGMDPKFSAGIINYILAITTISVPAITGIFFLWGRASTLSFLSDAVERKSQEASARTRAQVEDQIQRNIELERQMEVREGAAAAAAVGAGIGFAVGGPVGAAVGAYGGNLLGDSLTGISKGLRDGQDAALWTGRPMALPAGDILDPVTVGEKAFYFSAIMPHVNSVAGRSNKNPEKDWIDGEKRLKLRTDMYSVGMKFGD